MIADLSRIQNTKTRMDGALPNEKNRMHIRYTFRDAQERRYQRTENAKTSTLFSRGKRTQTFFTEDSHRYITPLEQASMLAGVRRFDRSGQFDSVQIRYLHPSVSASETLYRSLSDRYYGVVETFRYLPDMLSAHISPVRVWNASIIGAIIFGMFSMTLIYRYLGQQVSAEGVPATLASAPVVNEAPVVTSMPMVLGDSTEADAAIQAQEEAPVDPLLARKIAEQNAFAAEVTDMVKGYPIEAMLPYILNQDKDVAVFLVAIGKKESNWGKRVPVRNGRDCFNYWGYRGIRDKMGTGGHTCFDSPEDAVNTVAKRIKTLVQEKKLNTPSKMIVWKCGSSCAGHSNEGVRKWISDVNMYVQELK